MKQLLLAILIGLVLGLAGIAYAARQALVPGHMQINETTSQEALVPGFIEVNETVSAAAAERRIIATQ